MHSHRNSLRILRIAVACLCCALVCETLPAEEVISATPEVVETLGIPGGLCVQLGAEDLRLATELARTGRFLVQVLDSDESVVDQARRQLSSQGLYGLVTVDVLGDSGRLPYTENLVNLLVLLKQPFAENAMDEFLRSPVPSRRYAGCQRIAA